MIKKSKKEKELEKEVPELEKKLKKSEEELKNKTRKLKEAQYSRRLKKVLRKIMGFSPRYEDNDKFCSNEFNALLDQLIEKTLFLFSDLEMSTQDVDCEPAPTRYYTEFAVCLDWSVLRAEVFEDEKYDRRNMSRRSEKKEKLLLKRQLPVEELAKIVFMAVILNAARKVLPVKWPTGGGTHGGWH